MKNLIAGNWKMNGTLNSATTLAQEINVAIEKNSTLSEKNDFVVCPPYHHLAPVRNVLCPQISLGAQNSSPFENGAYTGDISSEMLKDVGCTYVILGHSERRQYYVESNMLIRQKALMANESGLITIICVGETEEEREENRQEEVVGSQLLKSLPETATFENTVIAYEPVWAIGTGKTATPQDIADMHQFIREELAEKLDNPEKVRILYGGSVKPANAAEIFAVQNVNGALIGGASLKAEDFIAIASAS